MASKIRIFSGLLTIRKGIRVRRYATFSGEEVANPILPSNGDITSAHLNMDIFSHKSRQKDGAGFLKLPLDTYPNPLFKMSKDEIIRLNRETFQHLLRIPYKRIVETDKFTFNIVEIINDHLTVDTKKAARYFDSIEDQSMKKIITDTLSIRYRNDRVRRSILQYIICPINNDFRKEFFENVSHILRIPNKLNEEKCNILLSYLKHLSLTGRPTGKALLLSHSLYKRILSCIPRHKYAEFYSYLLHLNIQCPPHLNYLRSCLMKGSNIEKFVARTGWLEPKWHDIQRCTFSDVHEQKMVNFFSVEDLKSFALFFIKEKDVLGANMYLKLLVNKFENKCTDLLREDFLPLPYDSSISDDVQAVLYTILNHVMVFRDARSCIRVLGFIVKNKLEVRFDMILTVLQNLRAQGYFQEALLLVNYLDLHLLLRTDIEKLVAEILQLIKQKFPTSPAVLIGYIAAMYSKSDGVKKKNGALYLLNELKLLTIAETGCLSSNFARPLLEIPRANVEEKLTNFELNNDALTLVYETILNSLPKVHLTPDFIYGLYDAYMKQVLNYRDANIFTQVFGHGMSDSIVTLLAKYLIKENPSSPDMKLVTNIGTFEKAKQISIDFLEKVELPRNKRSVYFFDLLIYLSLCVHQDYLFASFLIRKARYFGLPFTFNQIYPFIMFHYSKKEYSKAEQWYEELVKHGIKASAFPAKDLFNIARELNWNVKGFAYRKLAIHRNHRKRQEMKRLCSDPILFQDGDIEDKVTEDLVGDVESYKSDLTNEFGEEMIAILHQSNLMKPSPQ